MYTEENLSKGTVTRWWIFGLALLVLTIVTLTGLSYAGIIFQTKVERKVFEESYQRKAGQQQQAAILQAQLAEIQQQLQDPQLDPTTRRNLRAQRAAIRVRLRALQQQR